jgi:uncharacterized protein (DUF427 family)
MDVVKVPGPDHPITLAGHAGRMLAVYNGHVIGDSGDVLILKEASYKPVAYFPRADVDMAYMARTELDTYCPYKGHAAYYTLSMDGNIAENAVWTYEEPHPAMELIRGRLAFYPNMVDVHEAHGHHADPGVAVRHTDSGSGASQSDHWQATATNPPV